MEFTGKNNIELVENDYAKRIAPFVAIWEAEKSWLSDKAKKAESHQTGRVQQ